MADHRAPRPWRPLPLSGPDAVYAALAALGGAAACLTVLAEAPELSTARLVFLLAAAGLAAAFAAGEAFTRTPGTYTLLFALHLGCCLLAAGLAPAGRVVPLALGLPLTLGACLHHPFPVSLLVAGGAAALVVAVRGGGGASAADLVEYALAAAALALPASLLARYRERLLDARSEVRRLDALVERLTRANLNYQEHASRIEEASIDLERRRITRDIHDVVGYTLTNTITMMEAITDLMRTNPLGVSSLVDAARENAEDGLSRVREALHLLRRSEVARPTGLAAVERLVQVYQRATEVKVEMAFAETPWRFPPAVDAALYHVVQEGLINAFRHGRATRVRVFLAREGDRATLTLSDNGVGAAEVTEGIGLAGMRERLADVGGTFEALALPYGFEIRATVPADGERTGP